MKKRGGKIMKFKIPIILSIVIIAVFCFYFMYTNKTINTPNMSDARLIDNVVEIEKNLMFLQLRSISFNDFKNKINPFVHSYYKDSYFGELEKLYNDRRDMAASTQIPLYEYISKVYSSKDEIYKYIYVKIPEKGVSGQVAKLYTFKKDDGEWNIISINYYVLSNDMKRPKKDVERFTKFNDILIEYESIKIIE